MPRSAAPSTICRCKEGTGPTRNLAGSIEVTNKALPSDILHRNRKITSAYYQILIDRVHQLIEKPDKWLKTTVRPPQIDDICVFISKDGAINLGERQWKIGRIVEVTETRVKIMYSLRSNEAGMPTLKLLERGWREVSIILAREEVPVNSELFFSTITCSDTLDDRE